MTGRNRSFDETEELGRAVDVFWSNGYIATSGRDLQRVMGVSSASVDNPFSDKRSLLDLGQDVTAGLRKVKDALHRSVMRGRADGSISDRLEATAFAKAILGTIVSIRVMSRTASETANLRVLANSLVAMLVQTSAAA